MGTSRRWGWGTLGLAGAAAVGLTACNPPAGGAVFTVTGAEDVQVDGPGVTCPDPPEGEVLSEWRWDGTIGGEEATLAFAGFYGETVDTAVLQIGDGFDRWYDNLGEQQEGGVVQESVDPDGTLHATATIDGLSDPTRVVHIEAALRCP